jgi:hypothetical protein
MPSLCCSRRARAASFAVGATTSALVRPNQLAFATMWPCMARLSAPFVGRPKSPKGGVQCIQLMEVPVPADGRAGAAAPCAFPIVHTLARPGRKVLRGGGLRECSRRRGDVVQHPVHREREALRARRRPSPLEGGARSLPSQVYSLGMSPFGGNAGEVSASVMVASWVRPGPRARSTGLSAPAEQQLARPS